MKLTSKANDMLLAWAFNARPYEACGFIVARPQKPDVGSRIVPIYNVSSTPKVHCKMDEDEQVRVTHMIDDRGETILAFYHSHPESAARLSNRDLDEARDLEPLYVIIGLEDPAAPEVRAYRISIPFIGTKGFTEEPVEVVDE